MQENASETLLRLDLHFQDGARRSEQVRVPCTIGRDAGCGVRIRHWRVARLHARLSCNAAGVVLEDEGSLAGTAVNGRRVARFAPLRPQDEIVIGPCLIHVSRAPAGPGELPASSAAQASGTGSDASLGHRIATAGEAGAATLATPPASGGEVPGQAARATGLAPDPAARVDSPLARSVHAPVSGTAQTGANSLGETLPDPQAAGRVRHDGAGRREMLREALLRALDLRRRDVASMSDAMLREEARGALEQIVRELPDDQRPDASLVRIVLDEAVGFGPLEPLLADPSITEIMVNRYDEIYVERAGRLVAHEGGFSSEQSLLGVIEKIVSPLGRRIDESSPLVDARLPDGSRVHAVIAPIALKGAALTLRKFPLRRPGMEDLVAGGSLDARMARFLALCVARRKNVVVAGGTGSGKTTLINVLSHCVPAGERIVTIEDAAELRLQHAHLIALEARPPNLEGKGSVTIRELVRNALRMRPDRIIVGECRGPEAFDMLAAMNTGHEGSLTSLHANSPRDALARLETMILMAGMSLPLQAVREHIAASVDLIVQQSRLPSGRRLVTAIVEVAGIEGARIQLQEIYGHDRARDAFLASGLVPSFVDAWREQGLACDMDLFTSQAGAGAGGGEAPMGAQRP